MPHALQEKTITDTVQLNINLKEYICINLQRAMEFTIKWRCFTRSKNKLVKTTKLIPIGSCFFFFQGKAGFSLLSFIHKENQGQSVACSIVVESGGHLIYLPAKPIKKPRLQQQEIKGQVCLETLPDRQLLTEQYFMEAVNIRKALGTLNLFPVTLCGV